MPFLTHEILEAAADAVPDRTAATLGAESITFGELRQQARRVANALAGLRIGHGDRVVLWADTDLQTPALKFAVSRLGAVFAPINPAYTYPEALGLVEYLRPRLLVVDSGHISAGAALASELGITLTSYGAGTGQFDRLVAAASTADCGAPQPEWHEPVTIFATSGSTGLPKGVVVSHRATWARTFAGTAAQVTGGGPGELVMFPMFHMASWMFAQNAWSGLRPAHFVRRADGDELLAALDRHHPNSLYCIPAVWRRILEVRPRGRLESLSWAMVGTSRVPADLVEEIKERSPAATITVSYGSTEAGGALRLHERDLDRKPSSVGLPVPGVRARLDESGELQLLSDSLMSGYFDRPEETAQSLQDGWYRTGDLAIRDDDGYFTIVGRRSEMIRTGGEWVAPAEVESALADYPGLVDVAVMGQPDDDWGEVVCAVVVMQTGIRPPTPEELRRHIGSRLTSFKHPRTVLSAPMIPRTPATGQVRRSDLMRTELVP